jgi:PadR family transcriptional regulator PadR
VRTTYALVAVAIALIDEPSDRHWGYELSRTSGVRPGVMYPILRRLLDDGWVVDGWEDQAEAAQAKRPPRRYYELTASGRAGLGALVSKVRSDRRFCKLAVGATIVNA